MMTRGLPSSVGRNIMRSAPVTECDAAGVTLGHDLLLRANMERVFNERDGARRLAAIEVLWTRNPMMYEADEALAGRSRISDHIGALHKRLPSGTSFVPVGGAIVNNDAVMLRWSAQGSDGLTAATGTDVAFTADGRIECLYVFLDPRG